MNSIYRQFAVSVLRKLLVAAGAVLVHRGYADDAALQEVAAGLAAILVGALWEFYTLHRAALYERWLVLLGLKSSPYVQPSTIVDAARERVRGGLSPE